MGTGRRGMLPIAGVGVLIFLFGAAAAQAQCIEEGLIAWWTLDEDDIDGETVIDVVGGNDARIVGFLDTIEGVCGDALHFDAAGNYVELPPLGSFAQCSVECWALAETLGGGIQGIVSTPGWAAGDVHFKFEANQIQVHKSDGVKIAFNAVVNEWYHIVYTMDSTLNELKLYVNGEFITQGTSGGTAENWNLLRIGSEYDGRYLLGIVDEVRMYERVLDADEVMINYETTCCKDVTPHAVVKATRELPDDRPTDAPAPVVIDVEETKPEVTGTVVITETLPVGCTVSDITPAPKQSNGEIVWEVDGNALPVTLSYKIQAPRCGVALFDGRVEWKDAGTDYGSDTKGENRLPGGCFGPEGYITDWLILGPIGDQPGCDIGPAEINADYLTDGVAVQDDILPEEGMEIEIDFALDENAGDIYYGPTLDDIPVWVAIYDNDGGINYNDEHMLGMPNDNVMAYAVCYVTNTTADDMEDVWIGTGSDDALEVWFDDQVWTIDACRGWGWPAPQETNGPVTLVAGVQHRVMTKTFEQGGGWNFYLRFQDAGGEKITDGLEVTLTPFVPLKIARSLSPASYKPGDRVTGTLTLSEVMAPPPAAVKITETLPAGWTATSASDGGTIVGRTVSWNLTGAAIANAKKVTYEITAPKGITATFSGTFEVQAKVFRVKGDTTLTRAPIPEENLSPWIAVDIGTPLKGGQEKISEESFNIWGGGADISARTDSFRFIHQPSTGGDLTMWVRVEGQDATNPSAKAGLMVRQSLEPGSPFYFVQATPKDGAGPRYRTSLNGNAGPALPISEKVDLPVWLKLVRKSNSFTAFTSLDGTTWEQNFRTATHKNPRALTLTEPVLVGFAVTAGDAEKVSGVMFRDFHCEGPGCKGPGGFHRGDIDGTGGLTIGDAIFLLNYQFAGGATPPCLDACDTDDSGSLTIGDPIYLLGYMFAGGTPPPAPGPPGSPCGPDTTGVPLGCEAYPPAACQ